MIAFMDKFREVYIIRDTLKNYYVVECIKLKITALPTPRSYLDVFRDWLVDILGEPYPYPVNQLTIYTTKLQYTVIYTLSDAPSRKIRSFINCRRSRSIFQKSELNISSSSSIKYNARNINNSIAIYSTHGSSGGI